MSRSALLRGFPLITIVLALFATAAPAEGQQAASPPPPATFKKVSTLAPLPDFIPGFPAACEGSDLQRARNQGTGQVLHEPIFARNKYDAGQIFRLIADAAVEG